MRTGGCDSRFIVSDSKANDCCFREALKDNVFHRPPSPHTCCVDPAADQEGDGGAGVVGHQVPRDEPTPFLTHTFVRGLLLLLLVRLLNLPCRGLLTLQPAEVSCAAGEPSVRSQCVNQRLLIAGTLSSSGSQPRPAPSVWGL